MAPARVEEEDSSDPVTAEYDVYLTPALQQQIYLLQYPNRARDRPYNARTGVRPEQMRIKPKSGYLEVDMNLNTEHNFNKYRALKWGESMRTGKEVLQSENATYGLAGGLLSKQREGGRGRGGGMALKDKEAREHEIQNDMTTFYDAKKEGKVFNTQTLGGQITKHDSAEEAGKPLYFVGAFRGDELHLSKVTGTVQMRPQFHHLDAEEQRTRLAGSSTGAAAGAGAGGGAAAAQDASTAQPAERARTIHQSYKPSTSGNPRGELEEQSAAMRSALQTAAEEAWVDLEYVDEDEEEAYGMFHGRMFVQDTAGVARLKSAMGDDEYLDAVSAPGRESPTGRRRKRRVRRKEADAAAADEEGEDSGAEGG
ncbi:hypothetical protein LTR37_021377 [Vermiconidia calcicola]|uniref:Uncharacterized protein n=1 Tax=Vermiconidia calcicola TaxID=1690605 RepID=A0ACC3MBQ8_9PEZI|nr:hypothetical protein LTR37_021377 [Vermiconidia calcicola]